MPQVLTGGAGSRVLVVMLLFVALVAGRSGPVAAQRHHVLPGETALAAAVAAAASGDTVILGAGDHSGPVVIDRPLHLVGEAGARIVGNGKGRVVTVDAPDVSLTGITITGSGLTLASEDAGVYVTRRGLRAGIVDNTLVDNLIGVYLKGAADARVLRNRIDGRQDLRLNERGNGVQIWNAPGSVIEDNIIRFGRDGIFVTTSRGNAFRHNRISGVRFAVHYMYTNDSEVNGNVSTGNHTGFAIMYSHGLRIVDNRSVGDRDRGLLFNFANRSVIQGNLVSGGAEKCVFLYNANGNRLTGNRFEGCEIGIHFTAGSEDNAITGNAFVDNRNQVKYVGTRYLEWSSGGRGNYWSDGTGFDLDGDGIAQPAYRPNGLVDQIVWRHPSARLLLSSPAMHLLRVAQSQFPGLHPGGVTDSYPLIAPPKVGQ